MKNAAALMMLKIVTLQEELDRRDQHIALLTDMLHISNRPDVVTRLRHDMLAQNVFRDIYEEGQT